MAATVAKRSVRQTRSVRVLPAQIVQRGGNAEEIIEADLLWAWLEASGEIGRLGRTKAQMPFADSGRRIAALFDQGSQRRSSWFDQQRRVAVQHPLLQCRPPRIASGKKPVPRGRADP
jgi:hypothetical protein